MNYELFSTLPYDTRFLGSDTYSPGAEFLLNVRSLVICWHPNLLIRSPFQACIIMPTLNWSLVVWAKVEIIFDLTLARCQSR